MASADTLCKKLLNVKHMVIESNEFYNDSDGAIHLRIKARPDAWHKDDCPYCGRRCPGYDTAAANAYERAKQLAAENPQKRGLPKTEDKAAVKVKKAREQASELKHSAYSLGKAPENLTQNQKIRLDMIQASDPKLYRAYCLKESLRLLLKSTDARQAETDLKHWLWWASHSRIPAFHDLYEKIRRHKEHILNTIRLGLSNARIEATNNKIKLMIRKAYGFRNIQNMMDMVYLVCSKIQVPLPNRKPKPAKVA